MVDDEDDEDDEDKEEDVKKAEDGDAEAVEVALPAGEGTAEDRNGDGDNVGDGSDVGDNGGNNVDDCEAIEAAAPVGPALSAASVDSSDEMPVYFGAGASMRTE